MAKRRNFDIDEHIKMYGSYYYTCLQIMLSDLPAKFVPGLIFDEGDDCYFDGCAIHIGKGFITATEEDEAMLQILYVLGHEAQHVLSTPRKYWMWGQENALRILTETLSKRVLGVKISDTKKFIAAANPKGYKFSVRGLQQFVHFILNSVEDGRIERIRCPKSRLFKNEMYLYRADAWNKNPVQKEQKDLVTIINQILTLSTMGIYQKGYAAEYAGGQVDAFVDSLLPTLAKATNARSCYDCMRLCSNIFMDIAPYVEEFFKTSDEDELEKALKATGQAGAGEPCNYPGDSNQEQTGEGSGDTPSDPSGSDSTKKGGKEESEGSSKSAKKASDMDGKEGTEEEKKKEQKGDKIDDTLRNNEGLRSINPDEEKIDMTDAEIDAWLNSMREQARAMLEDKVKEMKNFRPRTAPRIKEVFDDSAPVEALKNSSCSEKFKFKEQKKSYTVDMQMPQFLEKRARAFARKLEKVFQQEDIPELENRTSGSVNNRDLYKLAVGELDFWKKVEEAGELDTCCYFLCDNSGSMGHGKNSKRNWAWECLTVIEEGFKKYMPLKITAFQQLGNKVLHECAKNWEERYNASCSYNYLMKMPSGASNADGYSIRIATKELLARPEQTKILFVLSDGLPAYSNGEADTKLAADEAKKSGIIMVPIYFSHDTVCDGVADLNTREAKKFYQMYGKDSIITIPEQIEDEVIRVLTKLVLQNL